jgi:CBS domain-containing protein
MATRRTSKPNKDRESKQPHGTTGRRDEVGSSGVYPMSGPHPAGDAPAVWSGSWGQGKRGAAGYDDHGESELGIPRVTPEKCRDIMTTDPVFCQAEDSAVIAAKLMQRHNIGALPVVGDVRRHKLVGIITDRDLAMRLVAPAHNPETTTVQEIMSQPVVTCSPDDDWQKAVELMERYQVKRVPAVDHAGQVVGMISQADLALRVRDEKTISDLVKSIAQPRPS